MYAARVDNSLVPAPAAALAPFVRPTRLSVRQRKRWLEILTSFDARNTYAVYDDAGNPVFNVQEQGKGFGSLIKRLFLAAYRPFRSNVEDLAGGHQILALRRPFRFMFHRLEVSTPDGRLLGALQKRWTWFRRKYTVEGPAGLSTTAPNRGTDDTRDSDFAGEGASAPFVFSGAAIDHLDCGFAAIDS